METAHRIHTYNVAMYVLHVSHILYKLHHPTSPGTPSLLTGHPIPPHQAPHPSSPGHPIPPHRAPHPSSPGTLSLLTGHPIPRHQGTPSLLTGHPIPPHRAPYPSSPGISSGTPSCLTTFIITNTLDKNNCWLHPYRVT